MSNEFGCYRSGIMNMVSSVSSNVNPSYIEVECFDLKNYKQEFAKYYKIDETKIKLKKTNYDLKQMLSTWNIENDLIESILYWISLKIGKCEAVYEMDKDLCNLLSWSEGGKSPFYIVDDAYFVEIENYMLCFILGNNE